tara:strand:+ start:126 stop:1445 length:1320 start_codon:yes stop_codon:yes gene_type:complete
MAQYQGLFTQGPSVEDLLQQRRTRSDDLQQKLMEGAAQGARDPMAAQTYSLLGSTLGRYLAGKTGGEDKQMEERKAAIAAQKEMQGESLGVERGGSKEMFAFAQSLSDKGFGDAAKQMNTAAIAKEQLELEKKQDSQKKAEDDLTTRADLEAKQMEAQAVQDYAFSLGNSFEDNKGFQTHLQSGRASPKIIELAEKQIAEKNETGPLTNDGKLLVESGMVAGTLEFEAAITDILKKKNTLTTVQSPMQQRQMLTGYIQDDKQYVKAKEKLLMVGDAFNLLPSVRAGGQKETALLERTVSEVYNSQTKAVSEIDRLVSKGSWGRGMQDWINNGFQGTPSAASIDEYENVLSIMDTAMRGVVNGVVDTQAGIYGDLMTEDNLSKSTDNLRVSAQREATSTSTSTTTAGLGPILGTSDKPNGSQMKNGTKYLIRDGKVYASD